MRKRVTAWFDAMCAEEGDKDDMFGMPLRDWDDPGAISFFSWSDSGGSGPTIELEFKTSITRLVYAAMQHGDEGGKARFGLSALRAALQQGIDLIDDPASFKLSSELSSEDLAWLEKQSDKLGGDDDGR